MLAGRMLPPILQAPPPPPPTYVPPVATFFNIPRRYAKSNMQVGDNASLHSSKADAPRSLRKSTRIHELRSSATTSPVQRTKEDQFPVPATLSPRAVNKRVAHFDVEEHDPETLESDSATEPQVPPSASSTGSGRLSDHICLCQPERKIPRPRNAFILYRQSQQHEIAARRPGVANPEISKIIGEQWKAEPDDIKRYWNDLAQAEKRVHQEKYPDYRYQPRRLGKPGSIPPNTPAHTTVEKYRCPRCGGRSIKTPTSPFLSGALPPTLPPPNPSGGLTPTTRYLPVMSNISVETPVRRRIPGPAAPHNIQMPASAREDPQVYSPMTPDAKRRRLNYTASSNGRRPDGPYYNQYSRRDSLPAIQMRHSPPNTATMPPPRTPRDARRGSLDLNLLVPNSHDQSRSVEAMVMSVPYAVKVKVLGRITPPLKEPGPTSPAVSIRGAIIAVEGENIAAVKELTNWLQDLMAKDKEFAPRLVDAPQAPTEDAAVTFEEYLDLIREWHGRSKEMVKYITTPPTPPTSSPSSDDGKSDNSDSSDKEADTKGTEDGDSDTPKAKSSSPSLGSSAAASASASSSPRPVIILPTYQLHAADAYASKIPIQDVYSPMDHWQWMATLWRGTVGPDLTIYVKSEPSSSGKVVELNEEGRCLTVAKEKEGKFAEAALRRVGFEVGEWVRGVAGRAA